MTVSKGVLVNILSGKDLEASEFEMVGLMVNEFTHPNATVIVGTVLEANMIDEIRVTIIATGIGELS